MNLLVDHLTSVLGGVLYKSKYVSSEFIDQCIPVVKGYLPPLRYDGPVVRLATEFFFSLIVVIGTYRNFTGVSFGHSPVEVVGKRVFTEAGQSLVAELEGRDVGCGKYTSVKSYSLL